MDAILAVSTLAMASEVAWADWVISCCGVGSEAMSHVLDCLIMVRLGETGGRIQRCQYLRNHQSDLLQTWMVYTWGCALPPSGVIFVAMMSWGAYRCTKCIQDGFLAEKTRKDTTWSVSWSVSWMSNVQYIFTVHPSFVKKQILFLYHKTVMWS